MLVWMRDMVVLHQVLVCLLDILPCLSSLEQAKVCKDHRWSSCDSRGAMDVNSMPFDVHHIVEVLSSSKNLHLLVFLTLLFNGEMYGCFDSL